MSANALKPRTLELSLVWAREAMTMTTYEYTNVVLYVLSLWFIKNEMRIACFLGAPNIKIHIFKSRNPSCSSIYEVEFSLA